MVQLQWKFSSTGKFKIYIFSRIFTNPAWQLDSTDIVTLALVCTAFADQDRISVFQRVQCSCAVDDGSQIPLISCKKNGERSKRDIGRSIFVNFFKCLTVGNHQCRLFPE